MKKSTRAAQDAEEPILKANVVRLLGNPSLFRPYLNRYTATVWLCRCPRELRLKHDCVGRPYGTCGTCMSRIFVGDLIRFLEHGLCMHEPRSHRTKGRAKNRWTSWCGVCRVRRFWTE